MKGQVSLEFIVVIAIFLAVLGVWLGGVNEVQDAISLAMGTQQANIAAEKIATAINSVCVMGAGNSIKIDVNIPGKAKFTHNGDLIMKWNKKEFEKRSYCDFESFSLEGKQKLKIDYDAHRLKTTVS